MKRKHVYLSLCLAGTILPYWQLVPWLSENGFDLALFVNQLFANRISAFFGIDVLVSAAVVFAFVAFERAQIGSRWWLPAVAVVIVGVSLGLPLLLYLRESGTKSAANSLAPDAG